jgi:hypothetical protein
MGCAGNPWRSDAMENYATRLQMVQRHVALQERLVSAQKETIRHLEQTGQPDDLARKMLQLMERTLGAFRANLARLANRPPSEKSPPPSGLQAPRLDTGSGSAVIKAAIVWSALPLLRCRFALSHTRRPSCAGSVPDAVGSRDAACQEIVRSAGAPGTRTP